LDSYRRGLAIQEKLAEDNPAVTDFRYRLAYSHHNIGGLHWQTGRPAEAMESNRRALAIREKLAEDNPAVTDFRSNLADSHKALGDVQSRTGHPAEALDSYRLALAIIQKLADDNPTIVSYQSILASSLSRIGQSRVLASDVTGAIAEFRRAVSIMERLPVMPDYLYAMACYQSLLAGVSTRTESGLSGDEQEALAHAAVTTLRRAIGSGYRNLAHMRTDTDLDPLRSRPDYRLLMMDLAFPSDPFAQ
jgi:eukaryotic-like serine/threonine-protein kinase